MPPVPRVGHADPLDPVDLHAAGLAVKHPSPEFRSRSVFTLKEFEPDLLRRDGDRVIGG
jgi:hypothetical protein